MNEYLPTLAVVVTLFLIHRSFHYVNPNQFVAISAVLIGTSYYLTAYAHTNPMLAFLIPVFLFPVFSFLWGKSRPKPQRVVRAPGAPPGYPPPRMIPPPERMPPPEPTPPPEPIPQGIPGLEGLEDFIEN